jgi:hypothetical protein
VFEIKPANQISGAIDAPPSPDLFILSAFMSLTTRAAVRVTPAPDTPYVNEWTAALAPARSIRMENATAVIEPGPDAPSPGELALPGTGIPYRDFVVFLLLGLGYRPVFASLSLARAQEWKELATRFCCVLEAVNGGGRTVISLSSTDGFAAPNEGITFDDLYPLLGLCVGLGKQIQLRTNFQFISVLRHLLPLFGCELAVKSNMVDPRRDPIARRIQLLQKKKEEESISFSITCNASRRPDREIAIDLPGDGVFTSVLVAAKSLIQKGNLIIRNVLLEPWDLQTVDYVRKMGCRPAIQEEKQGGFGGVGMMQLQNFALSSRNITCRPACHVADHLAAMSVCAAFAEGQSVFRGLEDLRRDLPDGLAALLSCVKILGARFGGMPDGMIIDGARQFDGFDITESLPAPLAAAFAVAGIKCMGTSRVNDEQIVRRWPDFAKRLWSVIEFKS